MRPETATAAIVLAAGRSARLGRPKQLVVFRGEPLVRRTARAAIEAGLAPVVVVTAAGATDVVAALAGLAVEVVENPAPERGLAWTVQLGVAGAAARAPGAAVVLLACDQPLLDAAHLRRLVEVRRASGARVVASEYGDVRGVPVLLGPEVLGEVAALRGDGGARDLVRRDPSRVATVAFAGGALDVDTEQDLARALALDRGGDGG